MSKPYKFLWGRGHNPLSKANMVSKDDLLAAIQSDPFTSIDNMISYNRWMQDTMYLGNYLIKDN